MRVHAVFAAVFIAVSGCGEESAEKTSKAKMALVAAGEIEADNVVIDNLGLTKMTGSMLFSLGEPDPTTGEMLYTGRVGGPKPAGPVIVYVFKRVNPETSASLAAAGVTVDDYTAYRLPDGADLTIDALREAQAIGRIDPNMTDDDIIALFGLPTVDEAALAAAKEREELQSIPESEFDEESKESLRIARELHARAQERLEGMSPDDPKYRRARFDEGMYEGEVYVRLDQARRKALEVRKAKEAAVANNDETAASGNEDE